MGSRCDKRLDWQEEHIQFLLPVVDEFGFWDLSFSEGLAVVSYERDNVGDDEEPLVCEYAQQYFQCAAYKAGDAVHVEATPGMSVNLDVFQSSHDEYGCGWTVAGVSEPSTWKVFAFTHAALGMRIWFSLADWGRHSQASCPGKSRANQSSQLISDRMPTWKRLSGALGFQQCVRSSTSSAGVLAPENSTSEPCATMLGLMIVFLRDSFGLRLLHAHDPPRKLVDASLQNLHALVRRFSRQREVTIYLRSALEYTPIGISVTDGCLHSRLSITDGGIVDLRHLQATLGSPCCYLERFSDLGTLRSLDQELDFVDCLGFLCKLPLHSKTALSPSLLAQLLWDFNLIVGSCILGEITALKTDVVGASPEHVHVLDAQSVMSLQRISLRYFNGVKHCTKSIRILGLCIDASRIANRKRMEIVCAARRKYACVLPTLVT